MWLFLYEAIADRTRCIVSVSQVSRLERIYVYIIHRERIFCGHSLMYVEDRLILKVIILIHPYLWIDRYIIAWIKSIVRVDTRQNITIQKPTRNTTRIMQYAASHMLTMDPSSVPLMIQWQAKRRPKTISVPSTNDYCAMKIATICTYTMTLCHEVSWSQVVILSVVLTVTVSKNSSYVSIGRLLKYVRVFTSGE